MGVVPCVAYKTYTVVTLVDISGLKILKKTPFKKTELFRLLFLLECHNCFCLCFVPAWAQAVAALMIIGLIILIIAFILAIVAMCNINTGLMVVVAAFLIVVGKIHTHMHKNLHPHKHLISAGIITSTSTQ